MSPLLLYHVNDVLANIITQLVDLLAIQLLQISR
jgi:hypothetical protein